MSGGYALHPEAFADLDDIRDYIAQENPDAAGRVISEIFDTLRGLVSFPIRATDARTSVRGLYGSLLSVNILIAYAPDEKPSWVVAVMHARCPRVMAAILRGRE